MRWFFVLLLLLNAALLVFYRPDPVGLRESPDRRSELGLAEASAESYAALQLLHEVAPELLRANASASLAPPDASVQPKGRAAVSAQALQEQGVKALAKRGQGEASSAAGGANVAPGVALVGVAGEAVGGCLLLGDFEERAAAEGVVNWLVSRRLDAALIEQQEAGESWEHWVYIPNPGDEEVVSRLQAALHSLGVDSYRIRSGALAGHLSVGLYRNRESALALRRALEEQGYLVRIQEQRLVQSVFRVLVPGFDDVGEDSSLIQDVRQIFPGQIVGKKPCPGVAAP